jgi:hypothetical protein
MPRRPDLPSAAVPGVLPKGAKGFKQHLPTKPCATCGRPMAWRKAWARCWDEVKHCSDACRRGRSGGGKP